MPDLHCIQSLEQLEQTLATTHWNRARVKFLARFLVALIAVKTVCLSQVASVFPGAAKPESHYKRIQRFLRGFDLDFGALAHLLAALAGPEPPWVLSLDRTNWKLGKADINFLVLALVHRGVAFPLVWTVLGKAGSSDTQERIDLLGRFVTTFGADKVAYLCADREFASRGFVAWLLEHKVSFRLRVKVDTLIADGRGQMACADWLFRDCPLHQERLLAGTRRCLGQELFVMGTRLPEDFLIVVSDVPARLNEYALRWGIETLFGSLKSRGFCLESTHVVEAERLSKLLGLLALAFCWALGAGVWLTEHKPLKLKKHGRAAVSLFRRGLDWLRRVLMPLCGQPATADFPNALRFLSCT
jgi:hypothetical protein